MVRFRFCFSILFAKELQRGYEWTSMFQPGIRETKDSVERQPGVPAVGQ